MSEKTTEVSLDNISNNIDEFTKAADNMMDEPVNSAALFIYSLYVYSQDEEKGYPLVKYMLNGIEPANNIKRLINKKIAYSYFKGATKENFYTPSSPYTVIIKTDNKKGLKKYLKTIYVGCSGTNSYRPITLIKVKRGKLKSKNLWFIHEYPSIILDIKE